MARSSGCDAVEQDGRCGHPVDAGAGLGLCATHLLAAYDWVARDIGVTDLLPSPCLACGSRLGVRYPSGWLCATCEWRVGDIPVEADASPRVDVVYYLAFGDRIKIGTSSNPRSRLSQLRFDELLAFERGDRTLEQRRHAQFANCRFDGSEWFHRTEDLDAHLRLVMTGSDPWDNWKRWVSEALALRT